MPFGHVTGSACRSTSNASLAQALSALGGWVLQREQHVVHRLIGHLTEILTHDPDERVRVRMRMGVYGGKHRKSRTRHAHRRSAQRALDI